MRSVLKQRASQPGYREEEKENVLRPSRLRQATRLSLPSDVVTLARERSEEMVRSVRELSGRIRVFGDLDSLVVDRPRPGPASHAREDVATDVAAQWLAMAIQELPDEA